MKLKPKEVNKHEPALLNAYKSQEEVKKLFLDPTSIEKSSLERLPQPTGYRVLVGASNVRRAKVAADMIKQGKAVPAPVMQAYAPVIRMIDDIVKGGYTFVRLLQTIHDRAKNKK